MGPILFSSILIIHGIIHLIGYLNLGNIKKTAGFSNKTIFPVSKGLFETLGFAWLLVFIVIMFTALIFLLDKNWWIFPGAFSVILSQLLIIIYWKDAKFGTISNLIILIVIMFSYGTSNFDRMVYGEVESIFSKVGKDTTAILTSEAISDLPPVIQKWIIHSGAIGKEITTSVRLKQESKMRLTPEGEWKDARAEQYFTVQTPAFIFKMDVNFFPLVSIVGRDKFLDGKGNMTITLPGIYTIADSKGKEIDQGTMIRFLSEIFWFPSAAISKYLQWEEVDSVTAKATMLYNESSVSVIVKFTSEGDVKNIEAERYGEFDGKTSLEKWSVEMTAYKEFGGIRIGNKAEVTWKLKAGDFTWYKLEITELEYNKPFLFN